MFKVGDVVQIMSRVELEKFIKDNELVFSGHGWEFECGFIVPDMFNFVDRIDTIEKICDKFIDRWVQFEKINWYFPPQLLKSLNVLESHPNLLKMRGFERRLGFNNYLIEN